jgi:hypothetical protein
MNSKKAITLLVLATMLLALVPIVPVRAAVGIDPLVNAKDDQGSTIVVTGDGVVAGKTVKLYWDLVQPWDGEAGLLNSSKAKSSGDWEVWFDVPEAVHGEHWIWIEDTQTLLTEKIAFDVTSRVKLSSTSGLAGDKVTVTMNGFSSEADVAILFNDTAASPAHATVSDVISGDNTETEFSGTFVGPVQPGTVVIANTTVSITDNNFGVLAAPGVSGTINYVTGKWEVEFDDAPLVGAENMDADYDSYVDAANDVKVLTKTAETNDLGKVVKEITVPTFTPNGAFDVFVIDSEGIYNMSDFALGPVITLNKEEGPSGTVVDVSGRGFSVDAGMTKGRIVSATLDGIPCYNTTEDWIEYGVKGTFKFSIVIPATSDTDEYTLTVTSNTTVPGPDVATADFEVTGLPDITISPEHGGVNDLITIEGVNFTQIKDEVVDVYFYDDSGPTWAFAEDFKTTTSGTFSGTFRVPAAANGLWEVNAGQPDMGINGTSNFRVGLVLALIAPEEGPQGADVTLSGVGFAEGATGEDWNATMGGELIAEGTAGNDGVFSESFFVPNIAPGDYVVEVYNIDAEITVTTSFTVTGVTYLELDPLSAANGYNITIDGWHFSEDDAATYEFMLYNDTDEWDITADVDPLRIEEDGNMTGYWVVYDDETLSLGTYWLNVTDSNDIFAQIQVDVVDEVVSISPKKSSYQIGDTVAFNVKSTFEQATSYIQIYDPSGSLYWETDVLDTWLKVGYEQVVPFYAQTSGGNPMILVSDAPLGTWSWEMYDGTADDDLIEEGTFAVTAAAADVIGEQVADLNNQITDLADQLSDVTSEFDDVRDDIASVSAIAQQAVTAAQQAAEAVQTVATTANQANTAAQNAATAAEAARDAANSLTTLVYGAIGAALVAALAAIVSLMQISRRIAG